MSKKKLLALLTASALTVGLLSGCGGGGGTTESPLAVVRRPQSTPRPNLARPLAATSMSWFPTPTTAGPAPC